MYTQAKLISYALPSITSIAGCSTQSTMHATDCQRVGGDVIVIDGDNFGGEGATVLVGRGKCGNVTHTPGKEHTQLTCRLAAGNQELLPVTVHTKIHKDVHLQIHTHTHTLTHTCTHKYTHTHLHTYSHLHVHTRRCCS